MQRVQALTRLLKQLVELVAEEARHNPVFAAKLDALLAPLPVAEQGKKGKPAPNPAVRRGVFH